MVLNDKKSKQIRNAVKAKQIVDRIMTKTITTKVYQLRDDLTDEEMMLALRDYLLNQRLSLSDGYTLDKIGYKYQDLWKEQEFITKPE